MPSVPPDRGRSGLRPLDEHQVVPGIQGLPSAARVRASRQVMPWRGAGAREERMAQKVSSPFMARMQPETLMRSLLILMTDFGSVNDWLRWLACGYVGRGDNRN